MIVPTKYTDIKSSILFIAMSILKYLRKEKIVQFDELIDMLIVDHGKQVKNSINIALIFLYAFNKIQYIKELDAVSLIEEKADEAQ